MHPPTFVFVDEGPWTSFNQMSARLRRKGYRTFRITCDHSLQSRWPSIFVYDEGVVVPSFDRMPRLDDLVGSGPIIDIQCPERLVEVTEQLALNSDIVDPSVLDRLHRRVLFGDKLTAMKFLRDDGVRVPSDVDGNTSIDFAIESLGLPLVMKPRRGSSGIGVVIVPDAGSFPHLPAPGLDGPALFEEYIDGEQLGFCAVFQDGIVIQEAGFERIRYDNGSVGPSKSLRTLDDDALFSIGRRVVALVGGNGLIDLDVIRDRCGRDFVVDVNLRAWGSLGYLLRADIDFVDGYLLAIGATMEARITSRAAPGIELSFLLFLSDSGRNPKMFAAFSWFIIASYRLIRDFGVRCWLTEFMTHWLNKFTSSGGFRGRRMLRTSEHSASDLGQRK